MNCIHLGGERWGLEPNSDKVGGSYLVQACRLSQVLRVDQGRSFVIPGGQLFPAVEVLKTCSQVWLTTLTPLGKMLISGIDRTAQGDCLKTVKLSC